MFNYAHLEGGALRSQAHVREDSPETDVVGITFTTIQRIMTQDKPDELLALYCFYAKETKRQKTQRIWCTTSFVGHGLQWGHEKVKRVKKRLIALGLIENVKAKKEDGKFTKPYILVRFVSHPSGFPTTGETGPQLLTESKGSAVKRKTPRETLRETPKAFGVVEEDAKWIPDNRSKEEKLKRIKAPRDFPSQQEFQNFLESEELDGIINRTQDLYRELCLKKWRKWDERTGTWKKIAYWKDYVRALERKIHPDF